MKLITASAISTNPNTKIVGKKHIIATRIPMAETNIINGTNTIKNVASDTFFGFVMVIFIA
jgi:hypothetical protein